MDAYERTALNAELVALGKFLQRRDGVFNAHPPPDADLIEIAIAWCKNQICPRSQELIEKASSRKAELATAICEVILWRLGNAVPGIPTIGRAIALIGIESFCHDSNSLSP